MPPSPVDPVAASAEQVRAQMASLAAAASPSHPRRRLPRLPEAATTILKVRSHLSFVCVHVFLNHPVFPLSPSTDFFFTKTRYPTTAQKDDLVAEIRAQFEGSSGMTESVFPDGFRVSGGCMGMGKRPGRGRRRRRGGRSRRLRVI